MISKKGYFAIKQPEFKKIEANIVGGVARISQRDDVILYQMVMDGEYSGTMYKKGDSLMLTGEAGLKPWAKKIYNLDGMEFVLVPETEVLGFKKAAV